MNALWSYFWPVFAAALIIGAAASTIGYRRLSRLPLIAGAVVALGVAAGWHAFAAGTFVSAVERDADDALVYYEMTQVTARLQRGPLARQLVLSGPADDFQRRELVRLLSQIPGVSKARWTPPPRALPLIAEALGIALAGFLSGLMLAYLIELRRRHNANWKW